MFLALFGEPKSCLEGDEQRRESTAYFLASIAPLILEKKKTLSIHSFKLLHAALPPFVKVHTIYVMSLFLNIYVYTF